MVEKGRKEQCRTMKWKTKIIERKNNETKKDDKGKTEKKEYEM